MPNTFDAVPQSARARSMAFLEMPDPSERLETIMSEAQLHRGSLREQDGYTIPFREGGQVRIRVVDEAEQPSGLRFEVKAPTEDRRDYIEQVMAEQANTQLADEVTLDWERD